MQLEINPINNLPIVRTLQEAAFLQNQNKAFAMAVCPYCHGEYRCFVEEAMKILIIGCESCYEGNVINLNKGKTISWTLSVIEKAHYNNSILKQAIEIYGAQIQQAIAIEEMAELTKEIIKGWRKNTVNDGIIEVHNKDKIIEEIADVEIMLDQLKICYDINIRDLEVMKIEKINRLEARIRNDLK